MEEQLIKLALDMLSIFTIFAKYKRIFSSTKVMINFYRNNLSDELVEMFKYLCARFLRKVGGYF